MAWHVRIASLHHYDGNDCLSAALEFDEFGEPLFDDDEEDDDEFGDGDDSDGAMQEDERDLLPFSYDDELASFESECGGDSDEVH